MPAAIAVMAPYVNSYRRYVKDHAAPINLEWGRDNRTTGIRIPLSGASSRRVENRLAGMDCNPYLGIAASLACGYLGLMNETRPDKQFKGDAYDGERRFPAFWAMRWICSTRPRNCTRSCDPEFARVYSHRQAHRVRGISAGDLPVGARTSAAERLSRPTDRTTWQGSPGVLCPKPRLRAMNLLHTNDRTGQYPPSWYAATADPLPPFAPLKGAAQGGCLHGRRRLYRPVRSAASGRGRL